MHVEHKLFENFGDGETSKQGQIVEVIPYWRNNVGQYRQ